MLYCRPDGHLFYIYINFPAAPEEETDPLACMPVALWSSVVAVVNVELSDGYAKAVVCVWCLFNCASLTHGVTCIEQVAEIEEAEKDKMRKKCKKIVDHGVNVFVNRQLIYNFPEQVPDVGWQASKSSGRCWTTGGGGACALHLGDGCLTA